MRGSAEKRRWLWDAAPVALIWLAASALAILVSHASLTAAALPDAIASGMALVGLRRPAIRRAGAACALVAAALQPITVLPWTLVAICLSVVVNARAGAVHQPALSELDRYLERCRRRGEPATALFVDVDADVGALRTLLRSARVTDSLVVLRSKSRFQVYGLLDGSDLTRVNVTARFADALSGAKPAFGWASYPADGLTLDVLLEQARRSVGTEPARSGPRGDAVPLPPSLEGVPELGAEHG